jgi:hypothetical protein
MSTSFTHDGKPIIQPSPAVWGPPYWFFLHSIAYYYPEHPNSTTKRKYYDLLHNMPLFIPNEKIGNTFSALLDKYPVVPYLDKRESFMRWVNFIHNKINYTLGKREYTIEESISKYEQFYTNPRENNNDYESIWNFKYNAFYSQMAIVGLVGVFVYYLYHDDY